MRSIVFIIERDIFSAVAGIVCCNFYSCGGTFVLHLRHGMETFPWTPYYSLQAFLITGYFGIKPIDGRRVRGFSLNSLNGRERGYSLASQGGMTAEDIEMMERR